MEIKVCCEQGIVWAYKDGYQYVFRCECNRGIYRQEAWPSSNPRFLDISKYRKVRARAETYGLLTEEQRAFLFRLIKHVSFNGPVADLISIELSKAIESRNKEKIGVLIEDIKKQENIN